MNKLTGTITAVHVKGSLSIVDLNVNDIAFKSIIIENPESAEYLEEGVPVEVLFKETEVVIGLNDPEISLQNRLVCTITEIEKGQLLSRIQLDFKGNELASVITTNACESLQLHKGMQVLAMIKTNEIMLAG